MADNFEHPVSHQAAQALLPWLANGTLAPAERDAVQDHAKYCVICRQELRELESVANLLAASNAEMQLPAPDMRRINARIDTSLDSEWRSRRLIDRIRNWFTNPWRAAFTIQTALLLLAVAWWLPADPEAEFTTLTTTEVLGQGHFLRIVFAPEIDPDIIERRVGKEGLVVIDGPTARGVYTLKFDDVTDATDRAVTLSTLRLDPDVLFVQPIPGGQAQ